MFNIKIPYVIATHVKKFTSTASLINKNKAGAVGMVSGVVYYHDGTAARKIYSNGGVVSATASTLALTAAAHDGRIVVLNRAAGITVTLPAATGSGAHFYLVTGTTLTSGSMVFAVANASDYMRGQVTTVGASTNTFLTANTGTVATESDTMTWNRTTSGLGTQGDYVEFLDLASNVWYVSSAYASSGVIVTPFSAAV